MKDGIVIQCCTPYPGVAMMELTKERHEQYCKKYDLDFQYFVGNVLDRPIETGGWDRIELVRRALDEGYQYVAWLDPDTMIYDFETDLREAFQVGKIGACWHRIPQLDHWNTGVLYFHNTQETRDFVDKWLNTYPAPRDGWLEQGVFNRMARQGRTVVTLSDKWNATLNVNMVPDAVVLGFHGQGNTKQRIKLMQDILEIANKKAYEAQAKSEVNNDTI